MTRRIQLPRPNATGTNYWKRFGFTDWESSAFKNITIDAIEDSPYLRKMIQDRVRRYLRAGRDGLTNREYFFRIRKQYIDAGITKNIRLLKNDDTGRTLAFKYFNVYKDTYGPTDSGGHPIGTPRPKTKAVAKRGTTKDRATQTTRNEIERLQGRLGFPMSDSERRSLQTQLDNQTRRLRELEQQSD